MTKAELVEEVSRVSDLTKKHSEVIVDTVFQSIIDALHRGEKIELRGFGSFRLRKREPRKGRNPKTGDKVDVPPKSVPYFKPGKELKDLINQDPDGPVDDGRRCAESPTDPGRPIVCCGFRRTPCPPDRAIAEHCVRGRRGAALRLVAPRLRHAQQRRPTAASSASRRQIPKRRR